MTIRNSYTWEGTHLKTTLKISNAKSKARRRGHTCGLRTQGTERERQEGPVFKVIFGYL